MERGKLYYASLPFARLITGRWTAEVEPPAAPTVFVCSHSNMRGPLAAQCWLPVPTRPWVLHMFLEKETCRVHYRDYTFTQRFGLPKPLAALFARASSGYVSALLRAIGAIPVYRGSVKIKETFLATVAALRSGDSVLIFPDVDYTDSSDGIGTIYDGFLLIDRFWRRITQDPLDFVPLRLDTAARRITAGEAVRFDRSADRKSETVRVKEALRAAINQA